MIETRTTDTPTREQVEELVLVAYGALCALNLAAEKLPGDPLYANLAEDITAALAPLQEDTE